MAVRPDITVDWTRSPRIVKVAAPSTAVSQQDLVDTLREREYDDDGIDETQHILNATGKDELGSGVLVGITNTLLNGHVQFEARTSSASTGTATSTGATSLIDSGADFVADGIVRGATIVNFTDQSLATVIEVVSSTELLHEPLDDGTLNTWTIGDEYKVWNVIQCDIDGGNLVALDDLGDPISPVLSSAFTQIVRTASASATLQELAAIQFSSYGNAVTIDPLSPYSGTVFPVGTPREPVNNLADAETIAQEVGLRALKILSDTTLDSGDWTGFTVSGVGARNNLHITVGPGANLQDARFEDVTLSGHATGRIQILECVIEDLEIDDGFIDSCFLRGTITPTGGASAELTLTNCTDILPGLVAPTIDLLTYTGDLTVAQYTGGLVLKNKLDPGVATVDLRTGRVVIDSTVVAGELQVRGIGIVEDQGAPPTFTVNANELIAKDSLVELLNTSSLELIDHITYAGTLLTRCRKRIFPNQTTRDSATPNSAGSEGALLELTFTATPDDPDLDNPLATDLGWTIGWTPP